MTALDGWLDEGLQHYTAGDPGRALAAWYRVLDVDPTNPAALQYIAVVRQVYRLGNATRTPPAQTVVREVEGSLGEDIVLSMTPPPGPGVGMAAELGLSQPAPSSDSFEGGASSMPPPDLGSFDIDVGPDSASWISSSWGDVAMGVPPPPPPPTIPRPVSTVMPETSPISVSVVEVDPPRPAPTANRVDVLAPPLVSIEPPIQIQPLDIIATPTPIKQHSRTPAIVDGPVRMSVMFDEPRPSAFARPGTQPPVDSIPVQAAKAVVATPVVTQSFAPSSANDGPSPWDDDGPAPDAIVLERRSDDKNPFRKLFAARTSSAIIRTPGSDTTAAFEPLTTPPSAPIDVNPTDEDAEQLMAAAREYAELGDFSNSLELVEQVLELNPTHEGARLYLQRNEATLEKMYESKLGGLHNVPRQVIDANEVIWMSLHHRAGFILSQVDGSLTFADVLEVSGMPRLATLKILADLMTHGVIGIA
jgi:hypothetical protein